MSMRPTKAELLFSPLSGIDGETGANVDVVGLKSNTCVGLENVAPSFRVTPVAVAVALLVRVI